LRNKTVEILIVGSLNAQVPAANVVNGFIVHHETAVRVFQGGVGSKDGVVGLNDGGGDLRSRVNAELELALLAIVDRQTLHQQSTEAGTGTAAKGVEDQETLKSGAVVGNVSNLVQHLINKLLSHCVMATSVVVGRVLLAGNHLFGMKESTVGTGTDLVDDIGLEITVDGTGNIFALAWCEVSVCNAGRRGLYVPVSEKKVLNPWSSSAALRSSVRYPSGYFQQQSAMHRIEGIAYAITHLNAMFEAVELQKSQLAHPGPGSQINEVVDIKIRPRRVSRENSPPSTSWQSGNRPGRLYA